MNNKIQTRLRVAERTQDTWALKAPFVAPLMGDGVAAQAVTSPLRGGPDSYLRQGGNKFRWEQVLIVPTRSQLVAARYQDWLSERSLCDREEVAA